LSLTFGDQVVGTTSGVQRVTVSNNGNAALAITNVGFATGAAGSFLVATTTCVGSPILPDNSCFIDVRFAPQSSGLLESVLRIRSTAGSGVADVPVSGSGLSPVISVSATVLDFGSNTVNVVSAPQTLWWPTSATRRYSSGPRR